MIYKPVAFQTAGPLSIVQITIPSDERLKILPFSDACTKQLIEVREVSEGGSVNWLMVHNRADVHVFLMDGDILTGAKQNRVLNTSVLFAPMSQTKIPVSCVEQGRWQYRSTSFSPTEYSAPPMMRKQKGEHVSESLHNDRSFDADQGAVWHSVYFMEQQAGVQSPTSNLTDVYEKSKSSLDADCEKLSADPNASGAVFFLHGKLVHADIFASNALFNEYYPKIVRGMSLELGTKTKTRTPADEHKLSYEAVEFLDAWENAVKEEHPGVGIGTELRAHTKQLSGVQLEYEHRLIHLGVFNERGAGKKHAGDRQVPLGE